MSKPVYDYIVVGAGSAGCVLASRLSEDPATRVLLVEAGPRDRHPYIRIPAGVGKLHPLGLFDWGLHSEPEPQLNDRKLEAMRGKVLGGSSSINMMAHTRGHPRDYDRWARNGAPGWSHTEVLPYFKRSETWQGGENAARGGSGPVGVQWSAFTDPLNDAWLAGARTLGYPEVGDYNAFEQEGFGRAQFAIRNGRRSSATAYLQQALRRPNLDIALNAHVARVLVEGGSATGIEYRRGGIDVRALASREVILCAGTFNTPQLLMLSGIGPAAALEPLGIRTLADLPVGSNLQDHVAVQLMWTRRGGGPFRETMRADRMAFAMVNAYLFGRGPASSIPAGLHAFIRTQPQIEVPDIEFMFRCAPAQPGLWFPGLRRRYMDGFGIRPTLLHPHSRGSVTLRSADPRDPVRIAFNIFSDRRDLATLLAGYRRARELAESAALQPWRGDEIAPGRHSGSERDLEQWIRRTAVTAHHPAGTCAMGTGENAVVDPELRVRGVQRLRVADASVMPDLVSAHINACVLMIAEKAAAMIKESP